MLATKSVDLIGMRRMTETVSGISPWQYFLTECNVIVTYIRLLFIPIFQNLDYDYSIIKTIPDFFTIVNFLLLFGTIIMAMKIFFKQKIIAFAIFWFF